MTIDTTVVNGRFVFPDGTRDGALSIHNGVVLDHVEYDDVWRTIDASGHLVVPGLMQTGRLDPASVQSLAHNGVTIVLVDAHATPAKSPVDYLPTDTVAHTLDNAAPASHRDRDVQAAKSGSGLLAIEASTLLDDTAGWYWDLVEDEEIPLHVDSPLDTDFPLFQFLYHEGHRRRGIPLPRIVAVSSSIPAGWYGLNPLKGSLVTGSHGDLFVFDPDTPDPYRHLPWPGRVICSLQRGNLLLYNGQLHVHPGEGLNLTSGR